MIHWKVEFAWTPEAKILRAAKTRKAVREYSNIPRKYAVANKIIDLNIVKKITNIP
jgi:hypothetical protein